MPVLCSVKTGTRRRCSNYPQDFLELFRERGLLTALEVAAGATVKLLEQALRGLDHHGMALLHVTLVITYQYSLLLATLHLLQ